WPRRRGGVPFLRCSAARWRPLMPGPPTRAVHGGGLRQAPAHRAPALAIVEEAAGRAGGKTEKHSIAPAGFPPEERQVPHFRRASPRRRTGTELAPVNPVRCPRGWTDTDPIATRHPTTHTQRR